MHSSGAGGILESVRVVAKRSGSPLDATLGAELDGLDPELTRSRASGNGILWCRYSHKNEFTDLQRVEVYGFRPSDIQTDTLLSILSSCHNLEEVRLAARTFNAASEAELRAFAEGTPRLRVLLLEGR